METIELTELQAHELKATNSNYMSRENIDISDGILNVDQEQIDHFIYVIKSDYGEYGISVSAGTKRSMKSLLKKLENAKQ